MKIYRIIGCLLLAHGALNLSASNNPKFQKNVNDLGETFAAGVRDRLIAEGNYNPSEFIVYPAANKQLMSGQIYALASVLDLRDNNSAPIQTKHNGKSYYFPCRNNCRDFDITMDCFINVWKSYPGLLLQVNEQIKSGQYNLLDEVTKLKQTNYSGIENFYHARKGIKITENGLEKTVPVCGLCTK